jgi:hypothetical protein
LAFWEPRLHHILENYPDNLRVLGGGGGGHKKKKTEKLG